MCECSASRILLRSGKEGGAVMLESFLGRRKRFLPEQGCSRHKMVCNF